MLDRARPQRRSLASACSCRERVERDALGIVSGGLVPGPVRLGLAEHRTTHRVASTCRPSMSYQYDAGAHRSIVTENGWCGGHRMAGSFFFAYTFTAERRTRRWPRSCKKWQRRIASVLIDVGPDRLPSPAQAALMRRRRPSPGQCAGMRSACSQVCNLAQQHQELTRCNSLSHPPIHIEPPYGRRARTGVVLAPPNGDHKYTHVEMPTVRSH
jgi:hypothetical protein